jgi:hypothetical protein
MHRLNEHSDVIGIYGRRNAVAKIKHVAGIAAETSKDRPNFCSNRLR